MRSLLLVAVPAAFVAAALASPDSAPSERGTGLPTLQRSCKPSGPVEIRLEPLAELPDGSIELLLSMRPVLPLQSMDWRLEMPYDVALVEGPRSGRGALAVDAVTMRTVRVRVPDRRTLRTVTLVVDAAFTGSDEHGATWREPVSVRTSVSWGERDAVGAPGTRRVAATGELERTVVLPARVTSPGRGPVYEEGR
jgi:hypothetical protein